MNTNEIIKALQCKETSVSEDGIGCGNDKCKYRDVDYGCDITSICFDAVKVIESLKEQLERKCKHEQFAMKCICDIETYLELGSPKYIKNTIDEWRKCAL